MFRTLQPLASPLISTCNDHTQWAGEAGCTRGDNRPALSLPCVSSVCLSPGVIQEGSHAGNCSLTLMPLSGQTH